MHGIGWNGKGADLTSMTLIPALIVVCAGLSSVCPEPIIKQGLVSKNACAYAPVTTSTVNGTYTVRVKCHGK